MTEIKVTCQTCRINGQPRRWLHWCEQCADEQREQHRLETGHDTDVVVLEAETVPRSRFVERIVAASRIAKGMGW